MVDRMAMAAARLLKSPRGTVRTKWTALQRCSLLAWFALAISTFTVLLTLTALRLSWGTESWSDIVAFASRTGRNILHPTFRALAQPLPHDQDRLSRDLPSADCDDPSGINSANTAVKRWTLAARHSNIAGHGRILFRSMLTGLHPCTTNTHSASRAEHFLLLVHAPRGGLHGPRALDARATWAARAAAVGCHVAFVSRCVDDSGLCVAMPRPQDWYLSDEDGEADGRAENGDPGPYDYGDMTHSSPVDHDHDDRAKMQYGRVHSLQFGRAADETSATDGSHSVATTLPLETLRWAAKYAPQDVRWFLLLDDETWVNADELVADTRFLEWRVPLIMGRVLSGRLNASSADAAEFVTYAMGGAGMLLSRAAVETLGGSSAEGAPRPEADAADAGNPYARDNWCGGVVGGSNTTGPVRGGQLAELSGGSVRGPSTGWYHWDRVIGRCAWSRLVPHVHSYLMWDGIDNMVGRQWLTDRTAMPLYSVITVSRLGEYSAANVGRGGGGPYGDGGSGQSFSSVFNATSPKYAPLMWWPEASVTELLKYGAARARADAKGATLLRGDAAAAAVEAAARLILRPLPPPGAPSPLPVIQREISGSPTDFAAYGGRACPPAAREAAAMLLRKWSAAVRHRRLPGFGRAMTPAQLAAFHPCTTWYSTVAAKEPVMGGGGSGSTAAGPCSSSSSSSSSSGRNGAAHRPQRSSDPSELEPLVRGAAVDVVDGSDGSSSAGPAASECPDIGSGSDRFPLSARHFVIIVMCSEKLKERMRAVNDTWGARARAAGATVLLVTDGGSAAAAPAPVAAAASSSSAPRLPVGGGLLRLHGALDPSYAGAQNRSLKGLQYAVAMYPDARWYWMVDDDTWVGVVGRVGWCSSLYCWMFVLRA